MLYSQSDEFRFRHISTSNGLKSSSINDILQDSRGFLWFATDHGLHRWDGYKMKVFYHDPEDNSSLSSSALSSIYEDSDNILWVGTYYYGLNRFNPKSEKVKRYNVGKLIAESKNQSIIFGMTEDINKNLWIGTQSGLLKFNKESGSYNRFFAEPGNVGENLNGDAINYIKAITLKDNSMILAGTKSGLLEFNIVEEKFEYSQFNNDAIGKFSNSNSLHILDIYEDHLDALWIATLGKGIFRYEHSKYAVTNYIEEFRNPQTLEVPSVNSIVEDSVGNMWLGTWDGLFKYDRAEENFITFRHNTRNTVSISSSVIDKVYTDRDNNLWIGTNSKGISLLPNWQKPFKTYNWDSEDSSSLGYGQVKSIIEDKKGDIWIASWGGSVSRYLASEGVFDHYTPDSVPEKRIYSKYVNVVYNDSYNYIWIGSSGLEFWDSNSESIIPINFAKNGNVRTIKEDNERNLWIAYKYSGLARYNRRSQRINYYRHIPDDLTSLSSDNLSSVYVDKAGRIWIGTINGLNRLDNPASDRITFKQYYNEPADSNSILSNISGVVYQDSKGRIWIGTAKGLNLFDELNDQFKEININQDLSGRIVQNIVEDDIGNLWIRWGGKLVRYNPDLGDVRIYDERDGFLPPGLPGRWDGVLYRGNSGLIYYGGIDKFVTFDPSKLNDNPNPPPVVITDFLLHNKSLDIGNGSPLKYSIGETTHVELIHSDNILSFEFTALDYTNPGKNQYAYKMEGVDDEWVYTDADRRFANYTNLDPGEYSFNVKASNSDGIWNEKGASLRILISPPFWATLWAYTIYACLLFGMIYILRRYELSRQNLKHNSELKQMEADKYREIDRMKSRFFANISHEFRTPLTLIKGPVQQMLSGVYKGNIEKQYKIILRNSNRLMQLINQLLDLSKLESGQMTLRTSPENILPLLKGLTQSFESLAKQKNISLKFLSSDTNIITHIDRDKFEKIIVNLLSNAFKFTPDGGNVSVNVKVPVPESSLGSEINEVSSPDVETTFVEIAIGNSGPGIIPGQLNNIFNRFYQVDDSSVRKLEGTGIGLALTKELVELHHGEIKVESEPGNDTIFTIHIPLGKKQLLPEEIMDVPTEFSPETKIDLIASEELESNNSEEETTSGRRVSDSPTLLIVDDNPDMRNYMRECLEPDYYIMEAENGELGILQALKHAPEIIISDVMMPIMDGFNLAVKIKTDERTSHIPIILLTAKASGESKIEGLETGADDYLTKPFDPAELLVRVKNLIKQRRKLQEKFRQKISVKPSDITVTSIDERFIHLAIVTVEKNISNPEFDTTAMADEMAVSRMLLHTKLKALTGESTGEFIRTIRLKRAAQLFEQGHGNVTEVAYDVGFQSLSYFAKTFRNKFGQSPSQYTSRNKNNSG